MNLYHNDIKKQFMHRFPDIKKQFMYRFPQQTILKKPHNIFICSK